MCVYISFSGVVVVVSADTLDDGTPVNTSSATIGRKLKKGVGGYAGSVLLTGAQTAK